MKDYIILGLIALGCIALVYGILKTSVKSPIQLDYERLIKKINHCPSTASFYELALEVDDFYEKYKATVPLVHLTGLNNSLYAAMRDRSNSLNRKKTA